MDIEFGSNRLQQAFDSLDRGQRLWGPDVARKYIQRIEVLYSAQDFASVQAMRSLRAHPLLGSRTGEWALDLTGRWRLIVIPHSSGTGVTVEEVSNHYE